MLASTLRRSRTNWVRAGSRLFRHENKRWFQMTIGQETISEADAALSLVRLAETGELGKVRLCEMCKERWRVAAKRSYRFCSDRCREDFYAKAPDYHGRKAANQRRYRENLK